MLDIAEGILKYAADLEILQFIMTDEVFKQDMIRIGLHDVYGFGLTSTFSPIFRLNLDSEGRVIESIDLEVISRYNQEMPDLLAYMEDKFGLSKSLAKVVYYGPMEDGNGNMISLIYENMSYELISNIYSYLHILRGKSIDEEDFCDMIVSTFNYGTSDVGYIELLLKLYRNRIAIDRIDDDKIRINSFSEDIISEVKEYLNLYIDDSDIEVRRYELVDDIDKRRFRSISDGNDTGGLYTTELIVKNLDDIKRVGLIHLGYASTHTAVLK